MSDTKKKPVSFKLDPDLFALMEKLADSHGVSKTWLLENALRSAYLGTGFAILGGVEQGKELAPNV
ncbi:MAG: CopG family transcriptional regulator [Candidatus Competibacteraceae bacterium]|nr:CopG family transcriptional regulator [Candidatus Competibacteraceae bacterium]